MGTTNNESELRARYLSVRERLENAISGAKRKPEDVRLIAVSKFHPAEMVTAVAAFGQIDFGENYVQEALEKRSTVEAGEMASGLRWHMIGHVQSRKASLVAGAFDLIHTLDSKHLADALEKRCGDGNVIQPLLVEVNVGEEAQKTGIEASKLHELTGHVLESCPHLALRGLMCIPPVYNGGKEARPYFARLRSLCEELRTFTGLELPELSMGMSGDFEWAVLEGATMVRVGTDIFGLRPPKQQ